MEGECLFCHLFGYKCHSVSHGRRSTNQSPENLNKYLDKKLDQIGSAGNLFGRLIGVFGRHLSKVIVAAGVLLVFGTAVFLWSLGQGLKKNK